MKVIRDNKEIRRVIELTFTRGDIIELIHKQWPALKIGSPVIDNVRIYFTVPGGGDWSGQDVDIDEEHPIKVFITRASIEETK